MFCPAEGAEVAEFAASRLVFVKEEQEEEELFGVLLTLLFFLQPPPTGTFLSVPPLVQYLLQALQKCLGCDKL